MMLELAACLVEANSGATPFCKHNQYIEKLTPHHAAFISLRPKIVISHQPFYLCPPRMVQLLANFLEKDILNIMSSSQVINSPFCTFAHIWKMGEIHVNMI